MFRDFTKHQRKILDLIFRLSYGCNKKTAVIPNLSDFQIAGVHKTDIGQEVRWLQMAKIITRDGVVYAFNKNFTEWQISIVKDFNPTRLSELLAANLRMVGETQTTVGETPTENNANGGRKVGETPTEKLVKHQLPGWENTNLSTVGSEAGKDNIKTDKDNTTSSEEEVNKKNAASAKKSGKRVTGAEKTGSAVDSAFLEEMKSSERYRSLDIDHERERCQQWCVEHRKRISRLRLMNWLDKEVEFRNDRTAKAGSPGNRRGPVEGW